MTAVTQKKLGRPPSEAIRLRREEEILDVAAKLFAKHGYSETATQALADVLQVGKGTIYRYFPSKEALFLAAVDRQMQQLRATIRARVSDCDDPWQRLALGVEAHLTFAAEHPELVELLIQERAQFKDRKKPTYFEYRDLSAGRWGESLRTLIEQGRVRNVPVERITIVIGDLLYGTMFANYFVSRQRTPQDQAQDIIDIALNGVLSESERKRRTDATVETAQKNRPYLSDTNILGTNKGGT
jgi:AcrR family transcriptional regulator